MSDNEEEQQLAKREAVLSREAKGLERHQAAAHRAQEEKEAGAREKAREEAAVRALTQAKEAKVAAQLRGDAAGLSEIGRERIALAHLEEQLASKEQNVAVPPHPSTLLLHFTPNTLHPKPYTLHLTPYTLHAIPYTLHPTP